MLVIETTTNAAPRHFVLLF